MKNLVFILITISLASSCKKHDAMITEREQSIKIRYPETAEEKQIVSRISEISDILKKVLRNKEANKEVGAIIKGGFYEDERVLIRDLLSPESSPAYQTDAVKKLNFKKGAFKSEYNKFAPIQNNIIALNSSDDYLGDIAIYFPYSENFDLPEYITLTPALYEANEGYGFVILDDSEYRTDVNDDYAYRKPTFIITNGGDQVMCANPAWCNDPLPPIPGLNLRRVEIGWARTKENRDNLIGFNKNNCGGNEVAYGRGSGYLRHESNGLINDFTNLTVLHFTRLDGRNKTWKANNNLIWDPNWKEDNNEQIFTVWEMDDDTKKEINGSITTTIKKTINGADVSVTGTLGFKTTVISREPISHQQNWTWNAYVGTARNPMQPNKLKPIQNNALFNYLLGLPGILFMNFSNGEAQDTRFLPNGEAWPIVNLGYLSDITWPYQIVR